MHKIKKGKTFILKYRLGRNENCCAENNHCHMIYVLNNLLFTYAAIDKDRFFKEIAPNFTNSLKSYFKALRRFLRF